MRSSLDFSWSEADGMNFLNQEIELVNAYVAVEKARFGSRLDFQLFVAEDYGDVAIPRLVLQPLVENALRHGVIKNPRGGLVQLLIEKKVDHLHFSIVHNGFGITKPQIDNLLYNSTTHGLGLINKRLLKYCGTGLTINSSSGHGTTISFLIPLLSAEQGRGGSES